MKLSSWTFPAFAILSVFLLPGCVSYGGSEDACLGVTCSGHGTCAVVDNTSACNCDPGYERDPTDPEICLETDADPIIVDIVTALSDPVAQLVSVSLKNHLAVVVEIGSAWGDLFHDILSFSLRYESPVYIELDPEALPTKRRILRVQHTLVSPVEKLTPQNDGIEVQFTYSAAIHYLYRSQPGFESMLALLESALEDGSSVVVTEKDGQGIIDVRPNEL